MDQFVLALDSGTTSCRALLFDRKSEIAGSAQTEFTQHYPRPGWVEHDAEEIFRLQMEVAQKVMIEHGITPSQIASIGITNQRETVVLWNKNTGKPIYNAIVWQDRRTSDVCKKLLREGKGQIVKDRTGLVIDAYFSATKIQWLLDHVDGLRSAADEGSIAAGTIDSWLVWKMTGGQQHVTDVSNASRTMLFNIHDLKWDEQLLDLFSIPKEILPAVFSSSEIYGQTTSNLFGGEIPIAGIAGDQQSALFGQLCIEEGMVKNTYGTGCFVMMNTGQVPKKSDHQLLTTIAWKIGPETTYALEGSVFIAGALIQWLRDQLGLISSAAEVEPLARTVSDNGDVYIVPAFAGLGAPHWDQYARGLIIGLTRGTGKGHIARAALESIAYQSYDVIQSMVKDSGITPTEIRVDGGAAVNDLLLQIQADLIHFKVVRPVVIETTAMGAAYLAGLAVGFWESIEDLSSYWKSSKEFVAERPEKEIQQELKKWAEALLRSKAWADG